MPRRSETQDPFKAVGSPTPGFVKQGDTFGHSQLAANPNIKELQTIIKFGQEKVGQELEKEQKANFVAGQAARAAGESLADGVPVPTRQGYNAMDAKLKSQEWVQKQKEFIDTNGGNDIDPLEYPKHLADSFKQLLTGDPNQDAIYTAAMAKHATDLGKYQVAANRKLRTQQGISQATQDVRNNMLALNDAQLSGDPEGEVAALEGIQGAISLNTILDPTLKQSTQADIATMGLDMGSPVVLNLLREQGVAFTPDQEKQITNAENRYNNRQKVKLDTKYQADVGDFEQKVLSMRSLDEFREEAKVLQETYPTRTTNNYIIDQEARFHRELNKRVSNELLKEAAYDGTLGKVQGTTEQYQQTLDAVKAEVLNDQSMAPEEREATIMRIWSDNGIKDKTLATELSSELRAPLIDGKLNPQYEEAFNKALKYYRVNPDFLVQHLSEEERDFFYDTVRATTWGGQDLGSAVSLLSENRVKAQEMTPEERKDYRDEVEDSVEDLMSDGIWSSLTNDAEIRTRLVELAALKRSQGMSDPVAAVQAAQADILSTHQKLGNALVFNNGKQFSERMGLAASDVPEAMDYVYEQLEAQHGFDRDDTVLLGDPGQERILIGVKNEFGYISEVLPVPLKNLGAHFRKDVLGPRQQGYIDKENAEVENVQDRMELRQRAIDSGLYNTFNVDEALGNWLGTTVLETRVKMKEQDDADAALKARYNLESDEEVESMKQYQSVLSGGITLNPEQIRLLKNGEMDKYLETLKAPSTEAPETVAERSTVRGLRNNNPGNIRIGGDQWQGATKGTDSEFITFKTPEHGIRAMAKILGNYESKHGLNTVEGIINRWAPPSENDTGSYIRSVAKTLGVGVSEKLNIKDVLPALIPAIIKHENGSQPYSVSTIAKGIRMAK